MVGRNQVRFSIKDRHISVFLLDELDTLIPKFSNFTEPFHEVLKVIEELSEILKGFCK